MERYEQFLGRHPRLAAGLAIAGAVLGLLGLSGLPEDLENWSALFQAVGSERGRWLVALFGLAVLGASVISISKSHYREAPQTEASPGEPSLPTRGLTWGDLQTIQVPGERPTPKDSRDPSIPRRELLTGPSLRSAIANAERSQAIEGIEAELVRLIDEWKLIRGDVYKGTDYGTYVLWERKTSEFIQKVLGDAERQRFQSNQDEVNVPLERHAELRIRALEKLRDEQDRWQIRLNSSGIKEAADARRQLTPQDHIMLAATPALTQAVTGGGESAGREEPRLSFGRAHLPREAHRITLGDIDGLGRIIQIPVRNDQGAGLAESVHAVLRFMPDDQDGSFSPRDPVQGEWVTDESLVTRVDLPGNGQTHLLNVALVLNNGYPCVFEWTKRSRESSLRGYEMWGRPIGIEIEIQGGGPSTPSIRDTLCINVLNGIIRADWASADPNEEATNWVGIGGRKWQGN